MIALVTGGSGGLGFHIAKELKQRGYDLVLVSRNAEKLELASKKLGGARYYAMDLSREYRKMDALISELRPSVVVNDAGFGMFGNFAEQEPDKIEEMLKLNILALTRITNMAIKHMQTGYILNISSVAACHPMPGLAAYAGSKAYVKHFTRSLSKELNENIHVSYLLLGPTKTQFFKNARMSTKKFERIMLSPEYVARYAVKKMLKGKTRIVPGTVFKIYCLFR